MQRPSTIELKRRYLSCLPLNRLVNTILDLEMRGSRLDTSFGSHMWPPDLEAAVREMEAAGGISAEPESSRDAGRGKEGKGKERRPTDRDRDGHPDNFNAGVNGLPNYEEMIVEALYDIGDDDGCPPKVIFDWIAERYPIKSNFRPSAHQAIQKSHKRGRLEKTGNKYRLNPDWDGTSLTKKATRRPKAASENPAPPPSIRSDPHSRRVNPAMSIEAALSLLVSQPPHTTQSSLPPLPPYTPPTAVQASLNNLAQELASRGRKRRLGDLTV